MKKIILYEVFPIFHLNSPNFHLFKKIDIPGVRTGPTAFNEMETQLVQFMGDADFILNSEGHIFRLGSVSQGCVVKFDQTHS